MYVLSALQEIRQNQRNTNCSIEADSELKIGQKSPPVPVEATVTVRFQKKVSKASASTDIEICQLDSPRDVEEGSINPVLEYPQFLDLVEQMPPVPVFVKLSRRSKCHYFLKKIFFCSKYRGPSL